MISPEVPDRLAYLWSNGWQLLALHNAGYDVEITAQGVCDLTITVTCAGQIVLTVPHMRTRRKAVRAAWRVLIDGNIYEVKS